MTIADKLSYSDKLLAVGGLQPEPNRKAEYFDTLKDSWTSVDDYPFSVPVLDYTDDEIVIG